MIDAFKEQRMKESVIYRDDAAAQKRKHRPLSKAGLWWRSRRRAAEQ